MDLSVALITYNQESLIGECLDSILAQRTDLDFEIVIGEDCSTDRTYEVVQGYAERNPGRVRVLHDRNHGVTGNFARTILACDSEFVALAEGDDHWLDPEKLQLQVDFLRRNPECVLCFHDAEIIEEDTPSGKRFSETFGAGKPKERTEIDDLIYSNYISTCSVVFRRRCLDEFPPGFDQMRIGDLPLFLSIAQHGWIGFIDRVMSRYRIHGDSTWAKADYPYRIDGTIAALANVLPVLAEPHAEKVRQRVFWWDVEAVRVLLDEGRDEEARRHALDASAFLRDRRIVPPADVSGLLAHAL